ncbi:MAG: type I-B CRISPR-associated protein Cas7/Csh2 [Endomicrobium sp.]|nr:type I-B CRISPR-associated protein Cas7/Csh2 [Endomicrobium sp.]
MTQIDNRSELIFIYDVKDANPNGDPLHENKPRIDEETKINYVTDVRLKRTIRDYIAVEYGNKEPNQIFMLAQRRADETLPTMKDRSKDFNNDKESIKSKCIDIRFFGATLAFAEDKKTKKIAKKDNEDENGQEDVSQKDDSGSVAITGPVQFRIGRSMHQVEPVENQISRVLPNDPGKKQGTFGTDQRVFYSAIKFYGMINENAAVNSGLQKEDIDILLKAVWNGTKSLNTRSKIGHMPRLLIKADYEKGFFIGDLDSMITFNKNDEINELAIRSCNDYELDLSKLADAFKSSDNKIVKVVIAKHPDLRIKGESSLKENKKIEFKEIVSWE